ncbi:MAG: RidA family protein [Caulobacteraceae bacterium]|nr:RidA family protein [Caulobacteraceae bacterium]
MPRKSITIEGFSHGQQPIPAASRVGPLLMTGGVHGIDPATGKLADAIDDQVRLMFENLGRILSAAGGGFENVVKMTVYVKDPAARPLVNENWIRVFPDAEGRPARHTLVYEHLAPGMSVQCDATAWLGD